MVSAIVVISVVMAVAFLFNPYGAQRRRTTVERWTARDRSHGWPYYWKFKQHMARCPKDTSGVLEARAYNRHGRGTRVCSNIIYLE